MKRTFATILFALATVALGHPTRSDASPTCGATDANLNSSGNWREKASIAECLRQHGLNRAARDYFDAATNVLFLLDDDAIPADQKRDIGAVYYHSALTELALRAPTEDIVTKLIISLHTYDDIRAATLLKRLSAKDYAQYLGFRQIAQAKIDQHNADLARDAAATPLERDQFEWWDRLSPDQRNVVDGEGGTRRNNLNVRPCRTSTADSRGIHIVHWYYCNPDNPSHETLYEFVNGKLESTIRV
jgi:hypothetical protein